MVIPQDRYLDALGEYYETCTVQLYVNITIFDSDDVTVTTFSEQFCHVFVTKWSHISGKPGHLSTMASAAVQCPRLYAESSESV